MKSSRISTFFFRLAQLQSSSRLSEHGETISVITRGASSSWDVAFHWDVAPEEMAMDDEESLQLTLGQEFVHELLDGYFRGVMNARKVCVLCHWASLSGVSEAIPYALSPARASSNANAARRWASTSTQWKPHG